MSELRRLLKERLEDEYDSIMEGSNSYIHISRTINAVVKELSVIAFSRSLLKNDFAKTEKKLYKKLRK